MEARVAKLYKKDRMFMFAFGMLGVFTGAKICDYLFYDEKKYLIIREGMEDEFWKVNGEPKNIKPDIVESHIRPGEMRKSWIQISLEKDRYIPR